MKDSVLITGATRGLGLALSKVFAEAGHTVIMSGRDTETLIEAAEAIGQYCIAVPGDLREHATISKLGACAELHEIDVLINNAGMYLNAPIDLLNTWDMEAMVETNLLAPMRLCQWVVPMMRRIGGGTIVNVGSIASRRPSIGETIYAATKGGLRAFSEALNRETAEQHIQVIEVVIGAMDTAIQVGRTPAEKCIDTIEAARTIYDLATAPRRTMRVTEVEIRRSRY